MRRKILQITVTCVAFAIGQAVATSLFTLVVRRMGLLSQQFGDQELERIAVAIIWWTQAIDAGAHLLLCAAIATAVGGLGVLTYAGLVILCHVAFPLVRGVQLSIEAIGFWHSVGIDLVATFCLRRAGRPLFPTKVEGYK
jgi:hypothetical protein